MRIQLINEYAKVPVKATLHAAGYDLFSTETKTLIPGERHLFKTGIKMEIPVGKYGRIAPRSGLAFKKGLDVMAGVIDADYRGDVGVLLINLSLNEITITQGDAIAQMIFETYHDVDIEISQDLNTTERGEGGFGHTDKKSNL